MKRKLIILLAFYQAACRKTGGCINIGGTRLAQFDSYRTGQYDHTRAITNWNTPTAPVPSSNDELTAWMKLVRPASKDYKEFRDEVYWIRNKEKILTTLQAQNLSHLVQEGFVVTNPDCDASQMKWLYKIFQDIMLAPTAKTIVTKHLDTKTREQSGRNYSMPLP